MKALVSMEIIEQKILPAEWEKEHDSQFKVVFDALRSLVAEPAPKEKKRENDIRVRTTRFALQIIRLFTAPPKTVEAQAAV